MFFSPPATTRALDRKCDGVVEHGAERAAHEPGEVFIVHRHRHVVHAHGCRLRRGIRDARPGGVEIHQSGDVREGAVTGECVEQQRQGILGFPAHDVIDDARGGVQRGTHRAVAIRTAEDDRGCGALRFDARGHVQRGDGLAKGRRETDDRGIVAQYFGDARIEKRIDVVAQPLRERARARTFDRCEKREIRSVAVRRRLPERRHGEHTIRDLMGISYDTQMAFPPDDTGYGSTPSETCLPFRRCCWKNT